MIGCSCCSLVFHLSYGFSFYTCLLLWSSQSLFVVWSGNAFCPMTIWSQIFWYLNVWLYRFPHAHFQTVSTFGCTACLRSNLNRNRESNFNIFAAQGLSPWLKASPTWSSDLSWVCVQKKTSLDNDRNKTRSKSMYMEVRKHIHIYIYIYVFTKMCKYACVWDINRSNLNKIAQIDNNLTYQRCNLPMVTCNYISTSSWCRTFLTK